MCVRWHRLLPNREKRVTQKLRSRIVVVVDHHWTFYAVPARSRLARSRATRSADPPLEALTLRLKWTTSSSGGVLFITSSLSPQFIHYILPVMLCGCNGAPTCVRDKILWPYEGTASRVIEERVDIHTCRISLATKGCESKDRGLLPRQPRGLGSWTQAIG